MRKKRHTTRNISSLRHLLFNPLLGSHFCLCFLGFVLQMHEQVNPFAEQPLSSWSFSFFISFDLWSFRSLSITSCFTAIRTCGSSVNKYQKYTHHRGKGHCTASPPHSIELDWIWPNKVLLFLCTETAYTKPIRDQLCSDPYTSVLFKHLWCSSVFLMGHPRPLFRLFSVFSSKQILQLLQEINVKKYPSSIW